MAATTTPVAPARQAGLGSTRALQALASVLVHLAVVTGAIVFTLPFLWMVRTSLLRPELIAVEPPIWIPWPPEWQNYTALFELGPFGAWMTNSVVVTVLATIGNTVTSAVVAFGFARTTFVGRDRLFVLVLATMMIPFQITLVPQYVLVLLAILSVPLARVSVAPLALARNRHQ